MLTEEPTMFLIHIKQDTPGRAPRYWWGFPSMEVARGCEALTIVALRQMSEDEIQLARECAARVGGQCLIPAQLLPPDQREPAEQVDLDFQHFSCVPSWLKFGKYVPEYVRMF